MLINVKMPTIVGVLTFISMINKTAERRKARNFFICRYLSFYEQSGFLCSFELEHEKNFINSGPGFASIDTHKFHFQLTIT